MSLSDIKKTIEYLKISEKNASVAGKLKRFYDNIKRNKLPGMKNIAELEYFMQINRGEYLVSKYPTSEIDRLLLPNINKFNAHFQIMKQLFDLVEVTNYKFAIYFANGTHQTYKVKEEFKIALSLLQTMVKNDIIRANNFAYSIDDNYYPITETPNNTQKETEITKNVKLFRYDPLDMDLEYYYLYEYKNYKINSCTVVLDPVNHDYIWYFDMTLISTLMNHPKYFEKIKLGVFVGTEDEIKSFKMIKANCDVPFNIIEQVKGNVDKLEVIKAAEVAGLLN
jgi:hypothetical protein